MTRYIEADALKKDILEWCCVIGKPHLLGRAEVMAVIDGSVTADVVEVVRCRDCEWRYTDECPMYYVEEISWDDDGWTETDHAVHDLTNDDGFCDKWERRKEDGTSF